MRRTANSYTATRTISGIGYRDREKTGIIAWLAQVPNYVWLATIVLTVAALSFTALVRSQGQEDEAKTNYSDTKARVDEAANTNQRIKKETDRIKRDPRKAAESAQKELRLVRSNEIVVSTK